jgi:CheY-like chemotaxis protein
MQLETVLKTMTDRLIWQNKVILLVEKDESNYLLLQEYFSISAVELIRVEDGLEIIDIIKSDKPVSLVLLDMQLDKGLSGLEATKIIKSIRPDLPVVFQTAHAMKEDKEKCFQSGCDDYISKPYTFEDFYNILAKHLGTI